MHQPQGTITAVTLPAYCRQHPSHARQEAQPLHLTGNPDTRVLRRRCAQSGSGKPSVPRSGVALLRVIARGEQHSGLGPWREPGHCAAGEGGQETVTVRLWLLLLRLLSGMAWLGSTVACTVPEPAALA